MPDAKLVLTRDAIREFTCESDGVRLEASHGLGMAKLQTLAHDPDAWFNDALGTPAPSAMREVQNGSVAWAWLAPGEWLVVGPEDEVERVRQSFASAAQNQGLMVDVTHARVPYELSGSAARAILECHCPLDFSEKEMPVGAAKRSIFSDTVFFVSRRPDRDGRLCFRLIFDQTMAGYAERLLGATISGTSL
jgi:sarcosine oxidase subunit gamma